VTDVQQIETAIGERDRATARAILLDPVQQLISIDDHSHCQNCQD
jgi:hypothetical protein